MLRKEIFIPGEYYHIYIRTIFGISEFKDPQNANKLAQNFLLANSTNSTRAFDYLRETREPVFERAIEISREGEKFVDVICYSIMPNHYHLLLKEVRENGIVDFVRRCNTSVAKYINIKNERKGPLFESKFNSKHVDSNEYLLHLSVYIHLNPLDFLVGKEWREHGLKDWKSSKEKLLAYPWSSLGSFLNEKNKNLIISDMDIILGQFNNKKEYESFLRGWSNEDFKISPKSDFGEAESVV